LYAAVDLRQPGRFINRPTRKQTGDVEVIEIVKLALEHGANPNARLKSPTLQKYHNGGDTQLTDGATPPVRAAKNTDLEAMSILLDKGANPNLATRNLTTPLMLVAGVGGAREDASIEAITLFLKHGADVNAFNNTGQTAMHVAVERSDKVVRYL